MIKPIIWQDERLTIIDQTRLPREMIHLEMADHQEVADAIRTMKVRGAPALGVVAAYGLALGASRIQAASTKQFLHEVDVIAGALAATRPTAVNLFQALGRMQAAARNASNEGAVDGLKATLVAEAQRIDEENLEADRRIGELGSELIEAGTTVLTHCNAGALATAGYGTALGVIRAAHTGGKNIQVLSTETRPLLQGARLTAYELMQEGIPVTLITDSMSGFFLHRGEVSAVIVGADRIAANGDVANKIGTYTLSVLAAEHGVPFYVAAPTTTIDPNLASGDEIPIEERGPEEVTHIKGVAIAPDGVKVANPAFDVTPHMYITALITERGVIREPYQDRIKRILTREA